MNDPAPEEGRSVVDGPSPATTDPTRPGERARIGWLRGIGSGLAIVVVSFALVVLLPDAILGGSFPSSRDGRGVLALVIVLLAVAVLATGLRRLQARGLI